VAAPDFNHPGVTCIEDPSPPTPSKYRLKPKENLARANDPKSDGIKPPEPDAFALRRPGRLIGQQSGPDEVTPVRRSNRRGLDDGVLIALGHLIRSVIGFLGRENLFILASSVARMVLFTTGLTWIMWSGIIRRY